MGSKGRSQKGSGLPPFLAKTYDMVDDSSSDHVVSWNCTGSSFIIWNPTDLSRDLLPKYFKHNNFSSFVRQLNTYGFRKMCPDQWEFATEGFLKGKRDSMNIIQRRKPLPSSKSRYQSQDGVESQHFEPDLCKCTISEHQGLERQVERLQQEKEELLDKLTKLQHEQQMAQSNLEDLAGRLQAMGERQQQIVSFFASFWTQIAQKPPESNFLSAFEKRGLIVAGEDISVETEDQQEVLAAPGDSGVHEIITGKSSDVQDEGFSKQLSLSPPSYQPLGCNPVSLASEARLKEAHAVECVENGECLDAANDKGRVLVGSGHPHCEFPRVGESGINGASDADHTGVDKQVQDIPWGSTERVLTVTDEPCEGSCQLLSLHSFSNPSLGTSPISLGSVASNGEVLTPLTPKECLETSIDEVCPRDTSEGIICSKCKKNQNDNLCYAYASEATIYSSCKRRRNEEVCYGHSSEANFYSRCAKKLGNDSLRKHLHCGVRAAVCSASKSSTGGKVTKVMADASGSNDGFWEKYLTENPPSSTDTESDSESNGVYNGAADPRERQFL